MITVGAPVEAIAGNGHKRRPVAAALAVAAVSIAVGALTSFGLQYLPPAFSSLANSAGAWTVIAFLAIFLSRSRPLASALLGAVAFVLMNETYALVSTWRGFPHFGGLGNQWNLIGVLIGPVVGTAASWVRSPIPKRVVWAAAAPSAVLIGEGIYGLTVIAATTSPVYWVLQIVAGAALVVAICVRKLRSPRLMVITITLTLAIAGVFVLIYALVPRLLFGF